MYHFYPHVFSVFTYIITICHLVMEVVIYVVA